MWSLVTNGQQIKTFGVTALLFWRHYRHQVAPEQQADNKAVCPSSSLSLFFFFSLTLCSLSVFLFSSFLHFFPLYFHLLLSVFTCLSVLLSLTTSCSPSVPSPPLCFVLPFFFRALLILCTCAVSKERR